MHCSKGDDYGGDDGLENLRAASRFGVRNWVGVMIRAEDKMARISNFARKGALKYESVEDSLVDLASYAILALIMYREETRKDEVRTDRS